MKESLLEFLHLQYSFVLESSINLINPFISLQRYHITSHFHVLILHEYVYYDSTWALTHSL